MKIKIGVSNRHVHLTKEHIEILFGEELRVAKNLVQPGEYASTSTVTLKTKKDQINNVRVLGPSRLYSQVEISKTDAYKLGLNPPVRESGDINGSESITLIGPKGEVHLNEGCIIASRHIHITNKDLIELGLIGKKRVDVLVGGEKSAILKGVSLKVSDKYVKELHLDTDDANANMVLTGDEAIIVYE
jgi:propanediol utilization protein